VHWSLCVVVNPGMVANAYKCPQDPTDGFSGIYFFDSLKYHSLAAVTKNVRKWLNVECRFHHERTPCLLPPSMATLLSEKSSHAGIDEEWFPFSKKQTPILCPSGMNILVLLDVTCLPALSDHPLSHALR
jgi:hypothetical protein